mgnify:CR=1 FL=1
MSVNVEGSGGNKLDTDLNLVPFIDLLSTLVLFLLLTTVWVQVAAIQVTVDSKGKSKVSETEQSKLLVKVTSGGFQLTWPAALAQKSLPVSTKKIDDLKPLIATLLKGGANIPASVSGDDGVEYGQVITALDALKEAGLTLVALSTE